MPTKFKFYASLTILSLSLLACSAAVDNAKDAIKKVDDKKTAATASPSAAKTAAPTGATASPAAGTPSPAASTPASAAPSPAASTPASAGAGWSILGGAFPCTDKATMWWEGTDKVFWGCGKSGKSGLNVSTDGGQTFTSHTKFGAVKIQGITRAPDGTLYVSGQIGTAPAAKVNESNPAKLDYTELYKRGSNAFTTVSQGENIAVTSDGQIMIEDLNGTNAVYSPGNNAAGKAWYDATCTGKDPSTYNPDASKTFCELHGVGEETIANSKATAYQITGLLQVNDKFYATGRKIDQPAQVRLPSKLPGAAYHFQTVTFQKSSEAGEMLDLYVWKDGRLITVGTDQSGVLPLIYQCDAGQDCYQASNWRDIELDEHGFKMLDGATARDGRAVDASGDTIVVVGNFVPNAKGGWAVLSRDGGKTWEDQTPKLRALSTTGKVENLYNVKVFDNGTVMLFGEENYIYKP